MTQTILIILWEYILKYNNNHIIEFFVNGKKYKKTKNRINDILKLILFKDL